MNVLARGSALVFLAGGLAAFTGRAAPSVDEEPPLEIYSEGKTRCQARSGIVIVTFTPLQGMSDVVKLFLGEADLAAMKKAASG